MIMMILNSTLAKKINEPIAINIYCGSPYVPINHNVGFVIMGGGGVRGGTDLIFVTIGEKLDQYGYQKRLNFYSKNITTTPDPPPSSPPNLLPMMSQLNYTYISGIIIIYISRCPSNQHIFTTTSRANVIWS